MPEVDITPTTGSGSTCLIGKSVWIAKVCEDCGAEFFLLARRARRVGRGRFCSRSCSSRAAIMARHATAPQVGPANPNWRGGVSQRPYRYTSRFRARFPRKVEAHRAVIAAVLNGSLVRPDHCSECGIACRPHAHHDDYAQPLVVRWLCGSCHRGVHSMLKRAAIHLREKAS